MKRALVVGATGYLGQAVVKALRGWDLVPTWLEADRPDVLMFSAYAGIPDGLNAVIYLAGHNRIKQIEALQEDEWDRVLDVNLKGAFLCARATWRALQLGQPSCFVAISSIMATHPYHGRAAYAAAKAGLEGLVRAMAVEGGGLGISSVAIRLGHLDKLMTSTDQGHELLSAAERRTPRGTNISPDEVASYILWLCEGGASCMNGAVVDLDPAYCINRWPL